MNRWVYLGIILLASSLLLMGCTTRSAIGGEIPSIRPPASPTPISIPSVAPSPTPLPPEGKVWLTILPKQCLGTAWEKDWQEQGNDPADFVNQDEKAIISEYYQKNGIVVYEIKRTKIADITCMACGCPTGIRYDLLIDESNRNIVDVTGAVLKKYNYVPANFSFICGNYGNNSATIMVRAPAIFSIQAKLQNNCLGYEASWERADNSIIVNIAGKPSGKACAKCVGMDVVNMQLDLSPLSSIYALDSIIVAYNGEIVGKKDFLNSFCGGIAAFQCPTGYQCILNGTYPDAGGSCQINVEGKHCGGFIQNAPTCPFDYECALNPSSPDTGGICLKQNGVLEGKVTIGPICPVERVGIPCDTPADAYTSRKIMIRPVNDPDNPIFVSIDENGFYSIILAPGRYTVYEKPNGIDRADGLPKTVKIAKGEATVVNVNIDTGIR